MELFQDFFSKFGILMNKTRKYMNFSKVGKNSPQKNVDSIYLNIV
jgi:hypothetical protein